MKKLFFCVMLAVATLSFSSCGGAYGMLGTVYTGHTEPVTATANKVGRKVGTVQTTSIFGIATFGDGSINQAAKMAGITKISHVDVKKVGVLGIFITYKYFVYGE